MYNKAFTFNSEVKYIAGGNYSRHDFKDLTKQNILVNTKGDHFEALFPDIFEKYRLTITDVKCAHAWSTNPMQFWQTQLNFAVWCATTGCGVSFRYHISSTNNLMRAVYTFHVYYQIRRILTEIGAPLPQDNAWDACNNPYNRRSYERICNEFGVSSQTDWVQHDIINKGLGTPYIGSQTVQEYAHYLLYGGNLLDMRKQASSQYHADYSSYIRNGGSYKKLSATTNNEWKDNGMNFTGESGKGFTIDKIEQPLYAETGWTMFIQDISEGFTQPGIVRINDSIRTYVWAILGAQAQARTSILGTGTAFDAQKQFLVNVESAIASPVDLPAAIKRYQDILKYAASKVDFVFGIGLYMAPSAMQLRIQTTKGYNNEIVIATTNQNLGLNTTINTNPTTILKTLNMKTKIGVKNHEEEKAALIVLLIAAGLLVLWIFK